jgi:hypothetical protein
MVSVQGQLDPLLLGSRQGKNIMEEGHGGGKLLTSWLPGSRERNNRKGLGKQNLQEHAPRDFL